MMAEILFDNWTEQQKAAAIPGCMWDRERRVYVFDTDTATPRAATVALILFPELSISNPELAELRDSQIQDVRPVDNAARLNIHIGAENMRAKLAEEGRELWEFQSRDLGYLSAVLKEHGGAYLGWERGMGKTIGSLCLVDDLGCDRVLIVAPNTAKNVVWHEDLIKYKFDETHLVRVLPNAKKAREACMEEVREHDGPIILVVHYEAVDIIARAGARTAGSKYNRGWDKYGEWDMVILDEAHRIKNLKARQTKAVKRLPTKMKLALSGTILSNHPSEMFSPLQWLFPTHYKRKEEDWSQRFVDWVEGGYGRICVGFKTEALEQLRAELGVFMVYRRKEDELDLPALVEEDRLIELSPKQRRVYNDVRDECLSVLDNDEVVAVSSALSMLSKLRQIATGLDLVGKDIQDSAKLDAAVEIIMDNDEEAYVVFSWYKAAARALQERLEAKGVECWVVDGDVPQAERTEAIQSFQNGERRVFIGTISTLGESVNLFRANNAIFLDRSWNPGDNEQARDRVYRAGQTKPVTITHLIAKDTVDERRVSPTLSNKASLRQLILGKKAV